MSVFISFLPLRDCARSRAGLELQILALRHQLHVLERSQARRLRLTRVDRLLWVWLSRVWCHRRTAVVIVKPDTVIAWHRRGFRLFCTWKSRHRTGRPTVPHEVRTLTRTTQTADISVLVEQFLQTFKAKPQQNLRLMLLEQLLADEIPRRQPRNVAQAKSFRELLEKTLQRYHNRLIDAATVVAEMLRMKQEMDASYARARELSAFAEEEIAFYDAIADNAPRVYDEAFLREMVHDVVRTIKRNLKVDWTEPHRDQVRAEFGRP